MAGVCESMCGAFAALSGLSRTCCPLLCCPGGRDIDATTRGLGGTVDVPVTSCGEENLTMVDDRWA